MCIPDVSPGYTGQFVYEGHRVKDNVTKAQKAIISIPAMKKTAAIEP